MVLSEDLEGNIAFKHEHDWFHCEAIACKSPRECLRLASHHGSVYALQVTTGVFTPCKSPRECLRLASEYLTIAIKYGSPAPRMLVLNEQETEILLIDQSGEQSDCIYYIEIDNE